MERIKSEITNVLKSDILNSRGGSKGTRFQKIFKRGIPIEEQIYSEVPIFLNLLETYFYDEEKFHGYLNSHYSTWINIFHDDFIRMILMYNKAYEFYRAKQVEKQAKMIKMADEYNSNKLAEDLEIMGLTPNIGSITSALKKSGISKKRPSMTSKKKK